MAVVVGQSCDSAADLGVTAVRKGMGYNSLIVKV